MRRMVLLGTLLVVGGLSLAAARQADAPKVIEVDKIKDNLFVLKGGGGNTSVFVTATGVVVVDAKNPGWGQPILDKIKTLTNKPVTMLINTHTHGDHVSGNVEFPATVDVIAQENTKANMEKMDIFKENSNRGMAKRTFKDKLTLGSGADEIDLVYFGPGHTNGDAWVIFPALRVAHAADMFWQRALPLVDAPNGGSVLHFAETLQKAHDGMKNVDTIINGHNPTTTTPADLQTFVDFNKDFLAWAQGALKAGKTPKQAAPEWKIPAKYQGYSPATNPLFGGVEGMLVRLQEEMK